MREHTPGPWQAEEASVRGITQEWFVRVDGDDIAIASDIRDRNGNHSEANARLIAAAPELLEALEDLASLAEAAMREVGEYEIDWNHPLIAAGKKKLAELNAAAKLPAIGQMSDHTPPPPRSSLTELAEPPVTAVTPQTPQIAVDATLELSIEQTGRLHVGPHTFTAAETTLLGRFLLATRGVWLNLNTRDQHAE